MTIKNKIFFLSFFLLFSKLVGQEERSTCETIEKIKNLIDKNHYKSKPLNDSLSAFVFSKFIEKIDPQKELLLENELNNLKRHKLSIDNYIINKNCDFLKELFTKYSQGINRKIKIINDLKNSDLVLNTNETIIFTKKEKANFKTELELKKFFKKKFAYEVLFEIAGTSKNKDSIIKNFVPLSIEKRNQIFENYNCSTIEDKYNQNDFNSLFITIFCSYFDPHTNYFSTTQKKDFLSTLSSDNKSYGLEFFINEKKECILISKISGSTAFYMEKIEIGDQLIKLKLPNDKEYPINCFTIKEVINLLNNKDHKNVEFQFKKKTGEIFDVNLNKEILKNYDNITHSFILDKEGFKTGYIKIPSFYSIMEDGKSDVSSDFLKEIVKLKEDKITNIIIDLEDNGGGSLEEAIKIASIFIKQFPIGYVKDNNTKQTMLPITQNYKYDGFYPITIIQNGQTASASEILISALRDYNLAVVIGTNSTGKATYQQIIPINHKNEEFLKITKGKIYRPNGKSNQYIGIIPDIEIPEIYDDQIIREKKLPNALKNDSVNSQINNSNFPQSEHQKQIITNYIKQLTFDNQYKSILKLKNKFNNLVNFEKITKLNFDAIYKMEKEVENSYTEIQKFTNTEYNFDVENTSFDKKNIQFLNLSQYNQMRMKQLKKNIKIFYALELSSKLFKK